MGVFKGFLTQKLHHDFTNLTIIYHTEIRLSQASNCSIGQAPIDSAVLFAEILVPLFNRRIEPFWTLVCSLYIKREDTLILPGVKFCAIEYNFYNKNKHKLFRDIH